MPDLRTHPADEIFGTSIIMAEVIAQELRERLARELSRHHKTNTADELLELARAILSEFEPLLAENLLNTDLAAWLAGMERVVDKTPFWTLEELARDMGGGRPPPRFAFPLAFDDGEPIIRFPMLEKAAERLAEKRIVSPAEFSRLTASERARAFTAAGDMSRDALQTVRDALAENVAEGTSLRIFREMMEERLDGSFLGPAHLETVYRTNVQASFHDGHDYLAANPIVAEVFPYQAYIPIHDGRVRDEHLALETLGLDGTNVYRRDDPFWDLFTPPWDFNCRCGINLLTIKQAARKGVREAQRWLETGHPPLAPEWRLGAIPFRPRTGFGGRRQRVAA